jgi:hypothetical protein
MTPQSLVYSEAQGMGVRMAQYELIVASRPVSGGVKESAVIQPGLTVGD